MQFLIFILIVVFSSSIFTMPPRRHHDDEDNDGQPPRQISRINNAEDAERRIRIAMAENNWQEVRRLVETGNIPVRWDWQHFEHENYSTARVGITIGEINGNPIELLLRLARRFSHRFDLTHLQHNDERHTSNPVFQVYLIDLFGNRIIVKERHVETERRITAENGITYNPKYAHERMGERYAPIEASIKIPQRMNDVFLLSFNCYDLYIKQKKLGNGQIEYRPNEEETHYRVPHHPGITEGRLIERLPQGENGELGPNEWFTMSSGKKWHQVISLWYSIPPSANWGSQPQIYRKKYVLDQFSLRYERKHKKYELDDQNKRGREFFILYINKDSLFPPTRDLYGDKLLAGDSEENSTVIGDWENYLIDKEEPINNLMRDALGCVIPGLKRIRYTWKRPNGTQLIEVKDS